MTDTASTPNAAVIEAPRSEWRDVWDQFRHHKGAMVGLVVLILLSCWW
jgi:peptide/nickel transport system permease protein